MIDHMSNAELADAITVAWNRSGNATEDQRIQQDHLKKLLAIQVARASTIIVADVHERSGEPRT